VKRLVIVSLALFALVAQPLPARSIGINSTVPITDQVVTGRPCRTGEDCSRLVFVRCPSTAKAGDTATCEFRIVFTTSPESLPPQKGAPVAFKITTSKTCGVASPPQLDSMGGSFGITGSHGICTVTVFGLSEGSKTGQSRAPAANAEVEFV